MKDTGIMSETIFVLMEEGWEYNDEVWFSTDGGTPHSFFLDCEVAQAACDSKNLETFKRLWKEGGVRGYCYGISELLPYEKKKDKSFQLSLDEICIKLFGQSFERLEDFLYEPDSKLEILSDSDEDWKRFMAFMPGLNFWEVVEVQKG